MCIELKDLDGYTTIVAPQVCLVQHDRADRADHLPQSRRLPAKLRRRWLESRARGRLRDVGWEGVEGTLECLQVGERGGEVVGVSESLVKQGDDWVRGEQLQTVRLLPPATKGFMDVSEATERASPRTLRCVRPDTGALTGRLRRGRGGCGPPGATPLYARASLMMMMMKRSSSCSERALSPKAAQ